MGSIVLYSVIAWTYIFVDRIDTGLRTEPVRTSLTLYAEGSELGRSFDQFILGGCDKCMILSRREAGKYTVMAHFGPLDPVPESQIPTLEWYLAQVRFLTDRRL